MALKDYSDNEAGYGLGDRTWYPHLHFSIFVFFVHVFRFCASCRELRVLCRYLVGLLCLVCSGLIWGVAGAGGSGYVPRLPSTMCRVCLAATHYFIA